MFGFRLLKILFPTKNFIIKVSIAWLFIALVMLGVILAMAVGLSPTVERIDTSGALYRDPAQSVDIRVEDLLRRMTTAEKIGQLALVEKNSIQREDITRYGIGGVVSGGGGKPKQNTPEGWLNMVNGFQSAALATRLGIPLLYGADGTHGHANVPGATIFPHFIGLGATRDAELVRRVAEATATEMAATGISWNFSPNLDVVQDTRWGRAYESFGSDPAIVTELGHAYVEGANLFEGAPIGTAKHYVGAGGMLWESSSNNNFKIDQGDTRVDEATLRREHLPPFKAAIEAGVPSVMVGLNSWDGVKLSANQYVLTDVLKGELGFTGFVVSDWYGVYEIPGGKYRATVTAINAGVDMVMLPFDYRSFTRDVAEALRRGDITQARLDDAVRRILTAKFNAGLFDRPLPSPDQLFRVGVNEHRVVAREAVRKSLVLLKNDEQTLPLSKSTSRMIVAGSSAHNLGRQSGGWTVEWQGIDGNWIPGTTILDGIKKTVSENTVVEYNQAGNFAPSEELVDVGIAIVGEAPYAEGWGDNEHPALTSEDLRVIATVQSLSKKIVVVIVSGRPLDIQPSIHDWDAVVAAWLPGSEGQGVADVLFGDYPFTGTLPVAWPL